MQDPDIGANIGLSQAPTAQRTREWILRAQTDATMAVRAIHFHGKYVGNVVLDQIDRRLAAARLSIYIGDATARGQGVGSTAIQLMIRLAFRRLNLNRVWLTVHVQNASAMLTYLRAGFALEGVLREAFRWRKTRIDALLFSMLASDFARRRRRRP